MNILCPTGSSSTPHSLANINIQRLHHHSRQAISLIWQSEMLRWVAEAYTRLVSYFRARLLSSDWYGNAFHLKIRVATALPETFQEFHTMLGIQKKCYRRNEVKIGRLTIFIVAMYQHVTFESRMGNSISNMKSIYLLPSFIAIADMKIMSVNFSLAY